MRIAIVNDVAAAAEAMRRVVLSSGADSVAWVAHDGASAVRRCERDKPDLILMDVLMPELNGVEATRRIMARTPCPIVVVTVDAKQNHAQVFEAMGAGALDAVNAPALLQPGAREGAKALRAKIETIRRLTGSLLPRAPRPPAATPRPATAARPGLVAIGASAGGPAALAKVLSQWPRDFAASVVIVQHVDVHFASGLARWLSGHTALPVRLAREGDVPRAGTALIAGSDDHLVLASPTRLGYRRQPSDASFRPSVDVFFQSVAEHWRGEAIGVLLTGMGRDGAAGLGLLRAAGHITIAQDEATSAVYGMPKAASELGAAGEVLPLDRIAPRITRILGQPVRT